MSAIDGTDEINESSAGETRAMIARRAYEKWQARGCPVGEDEKDWFEAEQEILAESAAAARADGQTPVRKRARA
jgi:hypothetical protein